MTGAGHRVEVEKSLGNRPNYKGFWKSAEGRLDLVEGKIFQNVVWSNTSFGNNPIHKRHLYFTHNSKELNIHIQL